MVRRDIQNGGPGPLCPGHGISENWKDTEKIDQGPAEVAPGVLVWRQRDPMPPFQGPAEVAPIDDQETC